MRWTDGLDWILSRRLLRSRKGKKATQEARSPMWDADRAVPQMRHDIHNSHNLVIPGLKNWTVACFDLSAERHRMTYKLQSIRSQDPGDFGGTASSATTKTSERGPRAMVERERKESERMTPIRGRTVVNSKK